MATLDNLREWLAVRDLTHEDIRRDGQGAYIETWNGEEKEKTYLPDELQELT